MRLVDVEDLSIQGAFAHQPQLLDALPDVTVAAFGGMAPRFLPLGVPLRDLLLHRIGMGSVLTFGNRHARTCRSFAFDALEAKEDWEARAFPVTLLLLRLSESSRFSFAADGRFHLSWQEQRLPGVPLCLLVDGSWKDWRKYARFATDESFRPDHRALLGKVAETLDWIWTTATTAAPRAMLEEGVERPAPPRR